jgi:hypothetical protein
MINTIRAGALATAASIALFVGAPANAAYVLETATAGPGDGGVTSIYGDGTNGNSNFIGASFTLSGAPVTALQVGANIDQFGTISGGATGDGGNQQIFAEIVSLSSLSSLPAVPGTPGSSISAWLQTNDLGHAILTVPATAGDASTVINFGGGLGAGTYALILGSGLYGTTGGIELTTGNSTIGSPNVFASTFGDSFANYGYDSGVRIFAAPVPLPAGLPLLASGLASGLAFLRRRRRIAITA